MTHRRPGRARRLVAVLVGAVLLAAGSALGGSGSAEPAALGGPVPAAPGTGPLVAAARPPVLRGAAGRTVLDERAPAVARLDPALRAALRRAVADAGDDGVALRVNSGWRSVEEQERLLRDAVEEHGSAREAARWVATPETSAHVSGDAVDVGPADAAAWLSRHGAAHGLCQVYDNEPWHFELRPDAVDDGCPPTYADPTSDPRMQR